MGAASNRRACNSANRALDRTADVQSPYLTSREALVYLRLGSLSALYTHIKENGLPVSGRIGRAIRFDKRELDAWLRGYDSALDMARDRRSA